MFRMICLLFSTIFLSTEIIPVFAAPSDQSITIEARLLNKAEEAQLKSKSLPYFNDNSLKNKPLWVECKIINNSSEIKEFWSWGCSYGDDWRTDNKAITILSWGCDANAPLSYNLQPSESKTLFLPLDITRLSKSAKFHMIFIPYRPSPQDGFYEIWIKKVSKNSLTGEFWSNELDFNLFEGNLDY